MQTPFPVQPRLSGFLPIDEDTITQRFFSVKNPYSFGLRIYISAYVFLFSIETVPMECYNMLCIFLAHAADRRIHEA